MTAQDDRRSPVRTPDWAAGAQLENAGRGEHVRPAARARRSRLLWAEYRDAYLMAAPFIIGFVIFTAGPMIASIILAFMRWELVVPPQWVGLENFRQLLTDRYVGIALFNTAYYTFLAVPLGLIVSLAIALLMNWRVPLISYHRTVFYVPSVTPVVASTLLWSYVFNPQFGLANAALSLLGLPAQRWFWDPVTAKPSFILMSLWGFGSSMVIFLAGLQGIPQHLYEAAAIDGAGRLARFRHVTLPMLTPTIFFNLVMGIIGSFQVFTAAYIITNGGPADATLFYVLYLFRNAFEFFKMGYASALAWLLFVIIMAFTLLQFLLSNRWVYYEGERN
ncbi:MAG: sugar ABC transporter permease [Chloroflexi bacterium]|nr:sugar ABC transporter permease [Chloroflexota bacterium]